MEARAGLLRFHAPDKAVFVFIIARLSLETPNNFGLVQPRLCPIRMGMTVQFCRGIICIQEKPKIVFSNRDWKVWYSYSGIPVHYLLWQYYLERKRNQKCLVRRSRLLKMLFNVTSKSIWVPNEDFTRDCTINISDEPGIESHMLQVMLFSIELISSIAKIYPIKVNQSFYYLNCYALAEYSKVLENVTSRWLQRIKMVSSHPGRWSLQKTFFALFYCKKCNNISAIVLRPSDQLRIVENMLRPNHFEIQKWLKPVVGFLYCCCPCQTY